MAWTTISKRAIGDCIPKSWLDTFIDNLTHLYNIAGGSGGTASDGLLNGSFENDVDADGIPDGWARTLYSGGSFVIETTSPAHGAKAIKFTSSGTGGGYLTTEDYILCSVSSVVNIQFVIWATAVGVHNLVELLWYDKAKGYLSTTAIFDDTATNPASATRYVRGAVPVASAEFYKIRLTGCKSDDATAGTT